MGASREGAECWRPRKARLSDPRGKSKQPAASGNKKGWRCNRSYIIKGFNTQMAWTPLKVESYCRPPSILFFFNFYICMYLHVWTHTYIGAHIWEGPISMLGIILGHFSILVFEAGSSVKGQSSLMWLVLFARLLWGILSPLSWLRLYPRSIFPVSASPSTTIVSLCHCFQHLYGFWSSSSVPPAQGKPVMVEPSPSPALKTSMLSIMQNAPLTSKE